MTSVAILSAESFDEWRAQSRDLLASGLAPEQVLWTDAGNGILAFAQEAGQVAEGVTIPRSFLSLAESVARHSDPGRWNLLYRVAWRLIHEARTLLKHETDADVRALYSMHKSVEKDIYRMRAFVRFRKVADEAFVAWYRPDHRTLDANEQFFRDRFGAMRWAILTPYQSMLWDCEQIRYGPGVPREEAPSADDMDDLWRAYYSSIYDPARINPEAMRAQLPVRYWSQLPESRLIAPLRRESATRVGEMARRSPVPVQVPEVGSLDELRAAIKSVIPHAVFGEGPEHAPIMLVGEQPGDEEDKQGRPFVGPAGRVLDAAIEESGLERRRLYLTNAVKTFLYVERGKRRIHQTPKGEDIAANRPWLTAEISLVRPKVIVCLGATAGQSVFGRAVRIGAERGRIQPHPLAEAVVLTYHPSAVLRAQEQSAADEIRQMLVSDLALARAASA